MMQIICYIFPAVVAVWVTESIRKQQYQLKEWVYHYFIYVISINFLISLLLSTVFTGADVYLSMGHFTHSLIVKYLGLSMILSFVLPVLFTILRNNFQLNLFIEQVNNQDVRKKRNGKK